MKVRMQLVLAFFLLAVLPLTGLTVYSYWSSLQAFRQVVEEESRSLAEEMGQRMESATSDLDRRFRRLEGLPFSNLMASGDSNTEEDANKLYSRLVEQIGEAAVFVDSLEFLPVVPTGEKVDSGTRSSSEVPTPSPAPPRKALNQRHAPTSIMIYMDETGNRRTVRGTAESVAHGSPEKIHVEVVDGEKLILRRSREADMEGLAGAGTPRANREEVEAELRSLEAATQSIEQRAAQAVRAVEEGHPIAVKKLEALAEKAAQIALRKEEVKVLLEQDFDCPIEESGKVLGTLKARVNAQQVLHSVLQRTRRDQGEIPFAIDADGKVYTPDPEQASELNELTLASAGFFPGVGTVKVPDDWIVVTRKEPQFGITLGIARPVGATIQEIRRTAARNLGYGLGMVALAILGILPLSNRMTRNLTSLSLGAKRLAEGDLDAQVPVRSKDEFGKLAETFNRMARDLKRNQENLLEQERLRKELEMCRQIQTELLPRTPLKLPFAEIRGVSLPAREVGGDFFNYFKLPDDRVAILIGDVSGKGVPAALLMANLQATLQARLPLERDLAGLAEKLDEEVFNQTPPGTYLTLFMAVLDGKESSFTWVSAGHNTQYVLRQDGRLERLPSTGRPLGLLPGGGYSSSQISLMEGDSLFLYTDGLIDMADRDGEIFGSERLESSLARCWELGAEDVLSGVESDVSVHRDNTEASDDATMMFLRIGSLKS